MILFAAVAAVIVAAMLIGASRSRVNAMPAAPPAADVEPGQASDSQAVSASQAVSPPKVISAPQVISAPLNDLGGRNDASSPPQTKTATAAARQIPAVPSIGSVQVLNGCGAEGAANRVADFLRSKGFDVKDIGNASSWNHQSTMVISRTADMGLANGIEKLLKTGKVVLIRNGDSMYDVTVVAGPDFEERIK